MPVQEVPFGQKVRVVRILRKMTQADLAEATGITQQAISDIEAGRWNPRPETEQAIRDALQWSPNVDSIFAHMLELSNVVSVS